MSPRNGPGTVTHSGLTDFGREMRGAGTLSLTEALRDRAWRTARAEAYRFQVAMALLGFVGGTIIVVPAVLWLVAARAPTASHRLPAVYADSVRGVAAQAFAPSAPMRTEQELLAPSASAPALQATPSHAAPKPDQLQAIGVARGLMRSGQVQAARDALARPGVADTGEAAFMLAETYDPNVLAALGVTGIRAEADTARRHYETALARGIAAAAHRLEALE